MDQETRKLALCAKAIMETLNETDGGPESHLYLGFGDLLRLEEFQSLLWALRDEGYLKINHHFVTATEKGRALFKAKEEA